MSNWESGSTRGWRRIRSLVLRRDGYRCRVQVPGVCSGRATCVHHTVGRGITGDDPAYLLSSCRECNERIGDPTQHDPPSTPFTQW